MIIEHEFLEQIMENDWTLGRAIGFLAAHDADPWRVLSAQFGAGYIQFCDLNSSILSDWKVKEIIRQRNPESECSIRITEVGARLVA